ncbi:MAG: hypothetical protein M1389_14415 [Chloroflexi bacterium]|nr:hypothetical protein [Chloroflexota bacterium]
MSSDAKIVLLPTVVIVADEDPVGRKALARVERLVGVGGELDCLRAHFAAFRHRDRQFVASAGAHPSLLRAVETVRQVDDTAQRRLAALDATVQTNAVRLLVAAYLGGSNDLERAVNLTDQLEQEVLGTDNVHGASIQPVLLVEARLLQAAKDKFLSRRRAPLLLPRQHRGSSLPDDNEELAEYLATTILLFVDTGLGEVDRMLGGQIATSQAFVASGRTARDPAEEKEEYFRMATTSDVLNSTVLAPSGSPPFSGAGELLKPWELAEQLRLHKEAAQPLVLNACEEVKNSFLSRLDRSSLLDLPLAQRHAYVDEEVDKVEAKALPLMESSASESLPPGSLGISDLRSDYERAIEQGPGRGPDFLTIVNQAAYLLQPKPDPLGPGRPTPPSSRLPRLSDANVRPMVAHLAVDLFWMALLATAAGALSIGGHLEPDMVPPLLVVATFALRRTHENVRFVLQTFRALDAVLEALKNRLAQAKRFFIGTWLEDEQLLRIRAFLAESERFLESCRTLQANAKRREKEIIDLPWPKVTLYLDDKELWRAEYEARLAKTPNETKFRGLVRNIRARQAAAGDVHAVGLSDGAAVATAPAADVQAAAETVGWQHGHPLARPLRDVLANPDELLSNLLAGVRPDRPVLQLLAVPAEPGAEALVTAAPIGLTVCRRLLSRTITFLSISETQLPEAGWTLPSPTTTALVGRGSEV